MISKRAILSFIFLIFCGCTGSVQNPTKKQQEILKATSTGQISFVSNSTSKQKQCADSNQVVLQVSLPSYEPFYCRDKSTLISGINPGKVCSGGVTVKAVSPTQNIVNCDHITLCGISPTSSKVTGQRFDGAPIRELTFTNLPWGCLGEIEYSPDANLVKGVQSPN